MKFSRIKHSFTSGELSPLMEARKDFNRYNNGCRQLTNMVVKTQGPTARRPGFEFIFDLYNVTDFGLTTFERPLLSSPEIRLVPFIFNENQSYMLVFYRNVAGAVKMLIADQKGLVVQPANPGVCPPGSVAPPATPGDLVNLTLPISLSPLQMDYAQSADELILTSPETGPITITRHSNHCWEWTQPVRVDQPSTWGGANDIWPETVTYHQQRLAFGGTRVQRQTVWMTKAGDFNSFEKNSPLVDSDSVTFTLDSGTQNQITWMQSSRTLNIGTIGNEWTVSGATRTALTPTNVLAQIQTSSGGERLQPILVDTTVLFVEKYGRNIAEFVYNFNSDSYTTSDMSILSDHLTYDYSIVDWAYQRSPDSIIWCVREDGTMLGITYQREHEVIAWHKHRTGGMEEGFTTEPIFGKFRAVGTCPGEDRADELWVIVERITYNGTRYYLEKQAKEFNNQYSDNCNFLDSSVTITGSNIDEVTGLDHLANLEVDIVADGILHPPRRVSTSGEITLDRGYSNLTVGLRVRSEVWPHLSEIPSNEGATHSKVKRTTKLDIDFYRSLGCTYNRYDIEEQHQIEDFGQDPLYPVHLSLPELEEHPRLTHSEEVQFREVWHDTNKAVPLFTGIKHLDFPEGFSRTTVYSLVQDQPFPMTIRSITDISEVNE